MNAIFNHAIKQKNQLNNDLTNYENSLSTNTNSVSLQGSISTTLLLFNKSITQFEKQKKNINPTDEEKFNKKLKTLRDSYDEIFTRFDDLKKKNQENTAAVNQISNADNPFSVSNTSSSTMTNRKLLNANFGNNNNANADDLLPLYEKEHSIFQRTNQQLDHILEMGSSTFDDLIDQNQILSKIQDKMTKSFVTLGLSNETIAVINKRVFKDKFIFYIALVLLFLGMYLVLKWLR